MIQDLNIEHYWIMGMLLADMILTLLILKRLADK